MAIYGELRQLPGLEQSYQLLARILLHGAQAERAAKTLLLERDVHAQLDLARRDESLARQRAEFDTERKEQSNRFLRSRNKLTARALEGVQRIDRLKTAVILLSALLLLMGGVFVARQLALARRLSALAMADELTGIGNRRSVLAFLDEQIRLHRASGKPLYETRAASEQAPAFPATAQPTISAVTIQSHGVFTSRMLVLSPE